MVDTINPFPRNNGTVSPQVATPQPERWWTRPLQNAETDTRLNPTVQQQNWTDLINALGPGGMLYSDGSTPESDYSGGGYNPQPYIDAIERQYNLQLDLLNRTRMQGLQGINQQYESYLQNIANDYAASQARMQTDRQQAAERFQNILGGAEQRQAEIAQSMAALGQQGASIAAQQAGNVGAMQASNVAQQNYMDRLAQIVAENQRQAQQQGALVKQGAETQYNQDYNRLQQALEMQKLQEIEAARSGGGGGGGRGGGGGGGGSKSDKLTSSEREQERIDRAFLSGDYETMLGFLYDLVPDLAASIEEGEVPEEYRDNAEAALAYRKARVERAYAPYISGAAQQQVQREVNIANLIQDLASRGVIPRKIIEG